MSGTTDNNWHSFVGPEDNGRVITSAEWLPYFIFRRLTNPKAV